MFLENAWRYIRGYINISVEGYFIERFLNLCTIKGIEVWNIRKKNEALIFLKIKYSQYQSVLELAKLTKCKINKKEEKGFPNLIKKYKHRKVFACVLVCMFVILSTYNSRIWNIEISGDGKISIEDLQKELEIEGIKIGIRKKDLKYSEIKNNIYLRRSDIAWLGFETDGTKMYVKFVERKNKDEDLKNIPCNIISDKDGIVEKILVRAGKKNVNKGDTVEKGQILISGNLSLEGSVSRNVHADGEIILKTWYQNKITVPYEKDLAYKTGKIEKKYKLEIGNSQINFINTSTKFEKYDTITVSNKLRMFNKFELPIKLTELTYEELKVDTIKYTKTQAENIAKEKASNSIQDIILNEKVEVLKTDYKIIENVDSVSVEVTAECLENVGLKEPILE